MSEQDSRADDFPRRLAEQGANAYTLAWGGEDNDPLRWMTALAPAVGRAGVDRLGADPSRLVLQEVTRARAARCAARVGGRAPTNLSPSSARRTAGCVVPASAGV
ncbi:hypothetical protein [Streptomyces sp. 900105245]